MANLDRIPTSDVRAIDIRDTLLAHGGDKVRNFLPTFFSDGTQTFTDYRGNEYTPNAHINVWAAYKPIAHDGTDGLDESDFSDGTRGIRIVNGVSDITTYGYGSITELISQRGTARWMYRRPSGTQQEPLRLSDFRGYDTRAISFIVQPQTTHYEVSRISGNLAVRFSDIVKRTSEEIYRSYSINPFSRKMRLSGIDLSDYYSGICLTDTDGDFVSVSAERKLGDTGTSSPIDIPASMSVSTGSYYAFFFISSVRIPASMNIPYASGHIYPIDGSVRRLISIDNNLPLRASILVFVDGMAGVGQFDIAYYDAELGRTMHLTDSNYDQVFRNQEGGEDVYVYDNVNRLRIIGTAREASLVVYGTAPESSVFDMLDISGVFRTWEYEAPDNFEVTDTSRTEAGARFDFPVDFSDGQPFGIRITYI